MTAGKRLRWGVLGTAKIFRDQIGPAFKTTQYCELAAIASRDIDRAKAAATASGAGKALGSYEALLADPDIDVIYNPLPNHLHAYWTIRALEAGKHVLCEKPIALSAAQACEIKAAQERTGHVAAEAFMVRFHPQWPRVRQMVREGRIGTMRSLHVFFGYNDVEPASIHNDTRLGGGALYDIGCYPIMLARFLFTDEPLRVIGLFDRDPSFGTDRLTGGLVAFPQGRQLDFTCSTQLAGSQLAILYGDRGKITMHTPINPDRGRKARVVFDDCRDLFGGGEAVEEVEYADQFALQCDAFARAILTGKRPDYTIDDAIKNMRVIDALFASESSQAWTRV